MRKYLIVLIGFVATIAIIGLVTAGYGNGDGQCDQQSFVDQDGDGVCDNYVDVDEDGMNDNCEESERQYQHAGSQVKRYGLGYERGNKGIGPCDSSGFRSGNCICNNV